MLGDLLQHARGIIQNSFVANSQDTQALSNHVYITLLIMLPLLISFVHRAAALNRQAGFATIEIHHIVTELMLPSEFETE